jgi:GntR family transcriptional regulator
MEDLIHRENPQKLYIQLCEIMKKKIQGEEWPLSSQIPTEDELCKSYNVSRATVRSAILELVRQGFLMRQQGKGTFVFKKVISDTLTMVTSFGEIMLGSVGEYSTTVLAQTIMMPVDDLSAQLNITEDKHIIYIKRLRTAEGKAFLIQESYIPFHICPPLLEEDIEHVSLFERFEKKHSIHITDVKSYFDVTCLNAEEGRLFDLPQGFPAAVLAQHFYSRDNQVMYTRSINRPDRFKFFMEFDHKTI